ncbi:MAG: MoxR family ATPase [Leptolyngbyaceae cyanobacterium MO_188.B28]|nr:MoxR family ATPase [Leptolyngbyaceae cyanobacterium MO_188.B28]
MTKAQRLIFEGKPDLRPKQPHKDSPKKPEPYVVSDLLKKAVNLAIFLRRPLLLEGDAGCGKTRLAYAVAYELGLPLYRWDVRSSTKAQDGLYEYDAILRLHDVEVQRKQGDQPNQSKAPSKNDEDDNDDIPPENRNPGNPKHYRKFGPLGKAFRLKDRPAVVLIDEIDKADLDFPNDLLTVLDEPWEFTIRETGEKVTADPEHKPIVIITSNKEKGNLPAPFLRRCLYRYLDFPDDPNELTSIVERHYEIRGETPPPKKLVTESVNKFLTERRERSWFKPPGTSEFLDWLKALHEFEDKPYSATQLKQDISLPYPELLFKRQDDWRNLAQAS